MEDELFGEVQILSPKELEEIIAAKKEPVVVKEETTTPETKPVLEKTDGFATEPVTREVTKEVKTETTNSNENRNEVVYKALIKELVGAGVITAIEEAELEKLPGSFDSIKKLISETVDTNLKTKEESWKKGFTGAKKRFLEIEDAFSETDQAIIMAQRLEYLDSIKEDSIKTNVDLQKQLYFEQLKAKNFSDEDAIEAITEAESLGKLEEKALKAFPDLKNSTSKIVEQGRVLINKKTAEETEAQNKAFQGLLESIEATESFVEGLALNKVAKEKLKANIVNPVYKDETTGKEFNSLMYKQHKNPVEFEKLINYYDTIGLFNLDSKTGNFKPDITKLKTVAKTAAVSELDKVINAEDSRNVGQNTSLNPQRTQGILDLLESATKQK